MNIELFKEELSKLGININEEQLNALKIYAEFLIEYNSHTNLTAITNINDIYLKHFYDSLTIIKAIDLNKINNLIDIGTGAGFPGMVIKILFPNINVTLLDSNNKKTKFLSELAQKLNIKNIEIVNARSEDYAKNHLDSFDLVTSRAVANLRVLTEICLPFTKVSGYFIPLKAEIEDELKISKDVINKLNGKLEDIITFNLPIENSIRNLVIIKKNGNNPKGYPRSYNIIKKEYERLK